MSEETIGDIISFYWSSARKTKHTPSGWVSGNAVCCPHQGHSMDTRKRGGIHVGHDGSIAYSCFNCGFTASWSPGKLLSKKMKLLCNWLNIPDDDIRKMSFMALKQSSQDDTSYFTNSIPQFDNVSFPPNTQKINNNTPIHILEYIIKRKLEHMAANLYYSTDQQYKNLLIIPFYYKNNLVGWSGRNAYSNNKKNRYVSSVQPGYVYGLEKQAYDYKFAIVTEGLIDSIHVNGVALLGSKISSMQLSFIKNLNKPIIFVPDRDEKGKDMVDKALYENWNVSMPNWDKSICDVSDAVEHYGKLATFRTIVDSVYTSNTKIQLMKRYWFT